MGFVAYIGMPKRFYAITIDKSTTDRSPTLFDYQDLIKGLLSEFTFKEIIFKVECYEIKHKSMKYPKWRHYHALWYTEDRMIKYTDVKRKGYSIKVKMLLNSHDVARWSGYVMKEKSDKM